MWDQSQLENQLNIIRTAYIKPTPAVYCIVHLDLHVLNDMAKSRCTQKQLFWTFFQPNAHVMKWTRAANEVISSSAAAVHVEETEVGRCYLPHV